MGNTADAIHLPKTELLLSEERSGLDQMNGYGDREGGSATHSQSPCTGFGYNP